METELFRFVDIQVKCLVLLRLTAIYITGSTYIIALFVILS